MQNSSLEHLLVIIMVICIFGIWYTLAIASVFWWVLKVVFIIYSWEVVSILYDWIRANKR